MIVPTVWLPALPPVPIRSGMKAANSISGNRSSTQSKTWMMYRVIVPPTNSSKSQPIRRRTDSSIRPCQ